MNDTDHPTVHAIYAEAPSITTSTFIHFMRRITRSDSLEELLDLVLLF